MLSFDCAPPSGPLASVLGPQSPQYGAAGNYPDGRPPFMQQGSTTSQNSMAAEVYLAEGGGVTRFKITDRSRAPSGEASLLVRDGGGLADADRDLAEEARRLSNAGKSDSTESRSLKTPSPAHRHHHR